MATLTATRGTTLPDSGNKTDLHNLVDTMTITMSNAVDNDISATAGIKGTKISPNFGSQNVVTTGTLSAGATTLTSLDAGTSCEANAYTLGGAATNAAGGLVTLTSGSRINGKLLGALDTSSYSFGTYYEATTDLFVMGFGTSTADSWYIKGYISATASGGTQVQHSFSTGTGHQGNVSMFVPKGKYFAITQSNVGSTSIVAIPSGT